MALRDRLAEIKAEADPLAKEGTALMEKEESTELSDEETARLEEIGAQYDELAAEASNVTASIEAMERRLDRAASFKSIDVPAGRPGTATTAPERPTANGGFAHFGEFLRSVYDACQPGRAQFADPRLFAAASGLQEAVGADGGFLVQEEFSTELLEGAHETGILSSRCRRVPAGPNANRIVMPMVDETSRADGSRWGAVQMYWDGEAEQFTKSRPTFTRGEWKLNKLTGLAYATDEMLEDSVALGAIIDQAFREEFGFKFDDGIFRGTGAGQLFGFMNAACKVSVAKESGQTAATINEKNVLKMWARMPASLRLNAVWLINQDAEPQLPQMTIGNQPVYLPPSGLSGTGFGSLMGRPVLPIEQCETVGTEGDIVLANLNEYVLYEKGVLQSAQSMHVRFEFGEMAFRFFVRADGKPRWKSALTPFKGTNTLSPFVTLATRA